MTEENARSDLDCTCYSITIKHMNRKIVDYREDLDKFIKHRIRPFCTILKVTYEQDTGHKLHAHILATSRWDILPNIRKVRYWSVDIQKTQNEERWLSYITKNAKSFDQQEKILLDHFSYHNNMFSCVLD